MGSVLLHGSMVIIKNHLTNATLFSNLYGHLCILSHLQDVELISLVGKSDCQNMSIFNQLYTRPTILSQVFSLKNF